MHDLPVTVGGPASRHSTCEPARDLFEGTAGSSSTLVDRSRARRLYQAGRPPVRRLPAWRSGLRAGPPVPLARGDRVDLRPAGRAPFLRSIRRIAASYGTQTRRAPPAPPTSSSRCTTSRGSPPGWGCGTHRPLAPIEPTCPAARPGPATGLPLRHVGWPGDAPGSSGEVAVVMRPIAPTDARRDDAAGRDPRRAAAAASCAPTSPPRPTTSTSTPGSTASRRSTARSRRRAGARSPLLGEALETGGRDPLAVDTIRKAARSSSKRAPDERLSDCHRCPPTPRRRRMLPDPEEAVAAAGRDRGEGDPGCDRSGRRALGDDRRLRGPADVPGPRLAAAAGPDRLAAGPRGGATTGSCRPITRRPTSSRWSRSCWRPAGTKGLVGDAQRRRRQAWPGGGHR